MKTMSIIVPAYNEGSNLEHFYAEITKVLQAIPGHTFEILFINDGSKDNTLEVIKKITTLHSSKPASHILLKYIDFSRNFGKEAATSAGLAECSGDAAIMIDSDLQHPVELIPEFITKWQYGAEVVVGVRSENKKAGLLKNLSSKTYYKIINSIGETSITPAATDYRLIDRKVIEVFNKMSERNRMTRGMIDWLGFKREYIQFKANPRFSGEASYSYAKLLKLALTSFISHSLLPLKLAGYLGTIITLVSGSLGLFMLVEKYFLGDPLNLGISPVTQLAVLIVFLIGVVLCCLGLVALYIGLIAGETQARPLYVIRERN
jgi:dolichol-phosphate mannosyltransferase